MLLTIHEYLNNLLIGVLRRFFNIISVKPRRKNMYPLSLGTQTSRMLGNAPCPMALHNDHLIRGTNPGRWIQMQLGHEDLLENVYGPH